jgi:partner of Y14 and mago protein
MAPPPSSDSSPSAPSKAGITVNSDGQRIIPASVRADGSVRPEKRVKPGYRPPEDVEVYKNRNAEAWKSRGPAGVPGAEPIDKAAPGKTDASIRNAKRQATRKKAKEKEKEKGAEDSPTGAAESEATTAPAEIPSVKSEKEIAEGKEKQAKAIRKKIRQANELKNRKDGGEVLLPEQLEKVIKLNELARQLKCLGFDQ